MTKYTGADTYIETGTRTHYAEIEKKSSNTLDILLRVWAFHIFLLVHSESLSGRVELKFVEQMYRKLHVVNKILLIWDLAVCAGRV